MINGQILQDLYPLWQSPTAISTAGGFLVIAVLSFVAIGRCDLFPPTGGVILGTSCLIGFTATVSLMIYSAVEYRRVIAKNREVRAAFEAKEGKIVGFYTGDGKNDRGLTFEEILVLPDDDFTHFHWLFPAHIKHEALVTLHDSLVARERFERAFVRSLAFFGLCYKNGVVMRAENWKSRSKIWSEGGSYHQSHITGILSFLYLMNMRDEARVLSTYLLEKIIPKYPNTFSQHHKGQWKDINEKLISIE